MLSKTEVTKHLRWPVAHLGFPFGREGYNLQTSPMGGASLVMEIISLLHYYIFASIQYKI